jgi:hypothetical protein
VPKLIVPVTLSPPESEAVKSTPVFIAGNVDAAWLLEAVTGVDEAVEGEFVALPHATRNSPASKSNRVGRLVFRPPKQHSLR